MALPQKSAPLTQQAIKTKLESYVDMVAENPQTYNKQLEFTVFGKALQSHRQWLVEHTGRTQQEAIDYMFGVLMDRIEKKENEEEVFKIFTQMWKYSNLNKYFQETWNKRMSELAADHTTTTITAAATTGQVYDVISSLHHRLCALESKFLAQ